MNITGMVHININCRDYARSKVFYEMLGSVEVWKVPATNKAEVNAAVGMQDYQVNGAITVSYTHLTLPTSDLV